MFNYKLYKLDVKTVKYQTLFCNKCKLYNFDDKSIIILKNKLMLKLT